MIGSYPEKLFSKETTWVIDVPAKGKHKRILGCTADRGKVCDTSMRGEPSMGTPRTNF